MPYNIVMYYQLNTLSGFSFYHSCILIEEYAKRAKELGYTGIGINDDNLFSYPYLAKVSIKNGLQPLFCLSIQIRNEIGGLFSASLIIKNEKGYQNLCQLLSLQKKEYDISDFEKYKEGLILIIQTNSDFFSEDFLNVFNRTFFSYRKIFSDDFYFGITLYSKEDFDSVSIFYDFTKQNDYHCIYFPKVCYLRKSDAYKKNLLEQSLIFSSKKEEEIPEIDKEGPYYLLSKAAIDSIYREEEIKNTESLVSKVSFDFFQKRGELIKIDDQDEILKEMSYEGLKEKLNCSIIPEKYSERLQYELNVIKEMHFSNYFLIVDDYVRFAKKIKIKVGPGRGSAGGSLVAYALNITQVDPIRFDLTFERFLNPYRVTMPDIDIDFEDERRDEVVTYLKQKYGEERISDIITFVRLKPRSLLNKIGPVLGIKENRLKKLTQCISEKANTFQEAIDSEQGYRFKELLKDPYYRDIINKSEGLLSLPINTSIHAPGVIISENPIYLSCPMSKGKTGTVQYEYPTMEELGFLKVDILALSNLTFLRKIEEEIQSNNKSLPDIYSDLNNKKVYETLNHLDLVEIFQLDTSFGMKKTIAQIKPDCFSDLAATIALFRPGPMSYIPNFANRKHQKEKITYFDERVKEVLEETYGIMVYQEQIMKVLQILAGFSLGEADLIRRAISKKKKDKIEEYESKFIQGCENNGITNEKAIAIFHDIKKFAEYGFNKSHAYSYGLITYTLLYYKTFFPKEFYTITLKTESLNSKKITDVIKELLSRNWRLRNPNINFSKIEEPVWLNRNIFLPLNTCTTQKELLDSILNNRNEGYISFYDFVKKNLPFIKDIKLIEKMIDCGYFDCLSKSRLGMKNYLSSYLNFARYGMDEKDVPKIKDDGEDIGEMFYLEKMAMGRILSCRLDSIFKKDGYSTYLVTDTSSLEMSSTITIEDESNRYRMRVTDKNIEKFDFLLVKCDNKYHSLYLNPTDVINCKRKVVKHE